MRVDLVPCGTRLRTKSCLLMWVLLTTQCGRCDDTPQPAQQVVSTPDTQEESESSHGARLSLLPHYGHVSTGSHHGSGGLVGIHDGLGGLTGLKLLHGRGLGDIYGSGFHGGPFGRHHTILQASGDNAYNPRNRLTSYGHPQRNQISDTIPAFEAVPVSQKHGTRLYEPHIAGIYPTARLWHYPRLEAHGIGVGLGVNHGAGTPQQYSEGSAGHHAGWMSAFHERRNVHGMAGLGRTGFPDRATTGHYVELAGPVMGTHKNITSIHGYGNKMGGYHTMLNDGYQGLAKDHNFGLHKDMQIGGAGKYLVASQYHGNGYYGMAGYHTDEFPEAGGYQTQKHHGINGYHGGGYHGNGHYGVPVRSHKANDVEEVSTHDTASGYKTPALSTASHARGLHVDLLHGGTAALDAGDSDHLPDEVSLTGPQNGIPAQHVPGGTHLTGSGNGNQGSSKRQQYLMGLFPNMLVGVGIGLQGQQFNENTDGQFWAGYDYHGGDMGCGVYLPWYNGYIQHYSTPHPSVQTDYGYNLGQFGTSGYGCVTPCNNLGLDGKLRVGLL